MCDVSSVLVFYYYYYSVGVAEVWQPALRVQCVLLGYSQMRVVLCLLPSAPPGKLMRVAPCGNSAAQWFAFLTKAIRCAVCF